MRNINLLAQRPAFPQAREILPRNEETVVTRFPVHGNVA
jgi:hypothetical protein